MHDGVIVRRAFPCTCGRVHADSHGSVAADVADVPLHEFTDVNEEDVFVDEA